MQRPKLEYDTTGSLVNPAPFFDPYSIKPGDLMEYIGVRRPPTRRDIYLVIKITRRDKDSCWGHVWDILGNQLLENCIIENSYNILLASVE